MALGLVVGPHAESDFKHDPGEHVSPGLERSAARCTGNTTSHLDLASIEASGAVDGCFQELRRRKKCVWLYLASPTPEMTIGEDEPRKNLILPRNFVKGHDARLSPMQPLEGEHHRLGDGIQEPLGAVNSGESEEPGIAKAASFTDGYS